jgi:hypothetical protein
MKFGIRRGFCGIRPPESRCPFQKAAQKYNSPSEKSIYVENFPAKENFDAH